MLTTRNYCGAVNRAETLLRKTWVFSVFKKP